MLNYYELNNSAHANLLTKSLDISLVNPRAFSTTNTTSKMYNFYMNTHYYFLFILEFYN